MELLELIKQRYSVRKFSDKPIEKEKLELVLKAGQAAPTACNFQPQRILVLDSKEALEKVKKCTKYHFNAPAVLLICYDNKVSWKHPYDNKDSGEIDASIVAAQMMLQAAEIGLGTTWVGYFCPVMTKREFALPENIVPVLMFPIGYPAEDSVPSDNHSIRLPLDKTVFYNEYPNE
jgi:nitroreductase